MLEATKCLAKSASINEDLKLHSLYDHVDNGKPISSRIWPIDKEYD